MMLSVLTTLLLSQAAPPQGCMWNEAKTTVVCPAQAFEALVDQLLEAKAESASRKLQLQLEQDKVKALEKAPAPVAQPKTQPKAVIAAVTAAVGAAALTTAVLSDKFDPVVRVSMGLAGSAALVGGVALTF